jgi:crotonobetainyl-CoA:carnitine CoA-transferase CaiB-like acyl-CoA transferase
MGPLEDLLIVEATAGMYGAIAGRLLADYGAEVVRFSRADDLRVHAPLRFRAWDRGKRVVPFEEASPRHEALDVLRRADLVIEDLDPDAGASLGLDHPTLARENPGVVTCHVSSYGIGHPWNVGPPNATMVAARLGIMMEQPGYRDGPIFLGFPMVEYGTALCIAIGGLAGLVARDRTGAGQLVDVSMLDAALAQLNMVWCSVEKLGGAVMDDPRRRDGHFRITNRRRSVLGMFRCSDGEYVQVHTGAPGAFDRAMTLLGLDDVIPPAKVPGLANSLTDEQAARLADLPAVFATRPRDEWLDELWRADVAALPVNRPGETYFDDHVQQEGMAVEVEDDELGRLVQPSPPIRYVAASTDRPASSPLVAEPRYPLEGVRVLDLGVFTAGPYGSRLLADLGADVIKIERLEGDPLRPLPQPFEGAQRGKRGVGLDLKTPEAREVLGRLIASADAVHHNMRPNVAAKLGADYETARTVRPEVIYVESPGFGTSGPKANLQSFAPLQAGFSGLFHTAAGDGNPPIRAHQSEDYYNAMLAAVATLMGLLQRARSGSGARIECPQLSASLWSSSYVVVDAERNVLETLQIDRAQLGYGPTHRLYRTADGWVCVWAEDVGLHGLCRAVGVDTELSLADDPLAKELEAAFVQQSSAALVGRLRAERVAVEIAGSSYCDDFLADDANLASGRVVEFHTEHLGTLREIGPILRFSDMAVVAKAPAPLLGEHTAEVLAEVGYTAAEIAELHARGCVHDRAAPPGSSATSVGGIANSRQNPTRNGRTNPCRE